MNIKNVIVSLALLAIPCAADAWDIKDLLGKAGEALNSNQNTTLPQLGEMAEGLFSKKDLDVKDLAGSWTVKGSAVSFQSDNFLQQAGGSAAASIVEGKLNPYYKKYGLTGAVLTIDEEGNFTLQLKKLTLSGIVSRQEAGKDDNAHIGNFFFDFNRFGVTSLGKVNTYVSKTASGLEIMFDASKLQAILGGIATFTKNKMAKAATDVLNSYDGICIGFDLKPASGSKGK